MASSFRDVAAAPGANALGRFPPLQRSVMRPRRVGGRPASLDSSSRGACFGARQTIPGSCLATRAESYRLRTAGGVEWRGSAPGGKRLAGPGARVDSRFKAKRVGHAPDRDSPPRKRIFQFR